MWLAYKDGAGAWTPVVGVGDVYTFTIDSGSGVLAFVQLRPGAMTEVRVHYMTQAEFTAGPLTICVPIPSVGRTITGTAAGLDMTETAWISLGGGGVGVNGGGPLAFTLTNVSDGTHDLVGYKTDQLTPGADTALLRRDVVVSGNGSVGTVDFRGSEAFAAATATITVGGLICGETLGHQMSYLVGATCEERALGVGSRGASTPFTASGIPGARQRASDYHQLVIYTEGSGHSRLVAESFHTLAARTVTLGASLPTPTVTSLGGPYRRLQAAYMLPADYDFSTQFSYSDGARSAVILASTGYVGGASVSLGLADFSGLTGWDNNWAPAASSTVNWAVFGDGGNLLTSSTLRPGESGRRSPCVEKMRFTWAMVSGTF
ncbi:MAG TPA: hypothetical protein VGQ06_06010 [Gemmatimonadales bacterium]|nr:hypothetical protein [Gemmatimonadales bacterium]